MWDFIRTSELDSISTTMLTPFPGTPFREQIGAGKPIAGHALEPYDTAHVTFVAQKLYGRRIALRL